MSYFEVWESAGKDKRGIVLGERQGTEAAFPDWHQPFLPCFTITGFVNQSIFLIIRV